MLTGNVLKDGIILYRFLQPQSNQLFAGMKMANK